MSCLAVLRITNLVEHKGQAAFYTEALYYFKERDEPNWKDYKVLPFKFIVESTINPGSPLVFTCSSELLDIGKNGRLPYRFCDKPYVSSEYINYMKFDEIKGFHQTSYNLYTQKILECLKIIRIG